MTKLQWISGAVGTLMVLSGAPNAPFTAAPGKPVSPSASPAAKTHGARSLAGDPAGTPRVAAGYGKLPLAFEPNRGQIDARVRFVARGGGMTAFFTDTETVMALSRVQRREPAKAEQAVVRMKLEGTMQPRQAVGLEKLAGISNYFIGNDPKKWRTDVPHYARIEYQGVYPGIDLVWYGNQRQLEYDFVVAPGADPNQIQVAYQGVESVGVEANGELVLRTALGDVRQQAPRVYQEIGGKRVEVAARYAIVMPNRVRFELAKYDRKRELRIDPVVLVYSTYLGGTGGDQGTAIAVDSAGSAYVTGVTYSTDFPTQSPYEAANKAQAGTAFVTKLTPAGNALVYSTYLGGSWEDSSSGIAVDSAGSAYVTGITASSDFPTLSPYQAALNGGGFNVFVTKLSPAGNALVYSTYLGGSGDNFGQCIAVDAAGSAYVTGRTSSTDFPTQSPYQGTLKASQGQNAFITKLVWSGSALSLGYSTYLGGSNSDGGWGIAVDGAGSAYVTGYTYSSDFPTQSPYQATLTGFPSAFATKLAPAGNALVYSTYLGGNGYNWGYGIAVDGVGSAYVAGVTNSTIFPTQSAYQPTFQGGNDAFLTKLTPAGNALVYSTYLGGSGSDGAGGIAVDASGSAYVAGGTNSTNFPTQSPYQATLQGSGDAFVTKLTPGGNALLYSTYLGGNGAAGIAVDAAGSAYITGWTNSTTFPTQSPYQATLQGGGSDAFVTKLSAYPVAAPILTAPANGATGLSLTPTLSWNTAAGATSYNVYLGTATPPPLLASTAGTTFDPGTLIEGATYYWQIAATDGVNSASSAIWSFTTQALPPPAPVLVSPANGMTGVSATPTLTWKASTGAASYDVYFGTAPRPPLVANTTATSYSPGKLTAGKIYYWGVVAKNAGGWNGSPIWSFTTQVAPPPAPVLTAPANGARGVTVAPTLTWKASPGATSYDVYFGAVPSPPLAVNTTATSSSPGKPPGDKTFYWRIVAKNAGGSSSSATWSFTTH